MTKKDDEPKPLRDNAGKVHKPPQLSMGSGYAPPGAVGNTKPIQIGHADFVFIETRGASSDQTRPEKQPAPKYPDDMVPFKSTPDPGINAFYGKSEVELKEDGTKVFPHEQKTDAELAKLYAKPTFKREAQVEDPVLKQLYAASKNPSQFNQKKDAPTVPMDKPNDRNGRSR